MSPALLIPVSEYCSLRQVLIPLQEVAIEIKARERVLILFNWGETSININSFLGAFAL